MAGTLDEIGSKYGSDKSSSVHGYLNDIENYIISSDRKPAVIIEICWLSTQSLDMWREWAPMATVIGVFQNDIAESDKKDGILYEFGRQDDPNFIANLLLKYEPDLVIDDGGHFSASQISSLENIFPLLPPGSAYVIEDFHTNFNDLRQIYVGQSGGSTYDYVSKLQRLILGDKVDISPNEAAIVDKVAHISFFRKLVLLRRNNNKAASVLPIAPIVGVDAKIIAHVPASEYCRGKIQVFDAGADILGYLGDHSGKVVCPEIWVSRLNSAKIIHEGIVITEAGQIVRESLINRSVGESIGQFRALGSSAYVGEFQDFPSHVEPGAPCVILTQTWDNNYGHWLVESLPRIGLLEEIFDIKKLRFLVVNRSGAIRNVYIKSLTALGVPEENIVWVNGETIIPDLIYVSPVTIQPWVKSPICVQVLEKLQQNLSRGWQEPWSGAKKLYVSRNKDSNDRQLTNEDELIEIAKLSGYDVIHPGLMDFEEQVKVFSSATHVCGNLGAGFTNIAFSPRGIKVLALASPHMVDDFFYDLCGWKEGAYWSLHGKGMNVRQDYRDDFFIDPVRFHMILSRFDPKTTP